jgi:elongation factor Ts
MAITASQVKELRDRTGAGMMECKKALVESGGDIEAAIEALRKSGLAKADKKAGRVAAEGSIVVAADDTQVVLVEVNCETDFVAKDDSFRAFCEQVAEAALSTDGDVDALLAHEIDGESIESRRQALVAKIGENIQVRRLQRQARSDGAVLASYVHGGRIGVVVAMQDGDEDAARSVAMHIAAFNPAFIAADDVPQDVLDKEKEILVAQAQDSGKPAEIIEKMVGGRLRKLVDEMTLHGQPFVMDNDVSVGQWLKQQGASVLAFHRLEVGEGIEKEETDFAAEVMQQVNAS